MYLRQRPTLVVAGALAVIASTLALTPQATAEEPLPPCAANEYIGGVAIKRWGNGDFKVVLFPTYAGRDAESARNLTSVTNQVWHLTQACIPGLYDDLADTVYAQIKCHVLGGWATWNGDYATGATWDLESWHPLADVRATTGCGSKSATTGEPDPRHDGEPGNWHVSFGPMPPAMIEESNITVAAPAEQAYSKAVTVQYTGGDGLWARTGPGGAAGLVEVLPEGTPLTLLCQTRGEMIHGPTSSDLWDFVRLGDGREYFVSDVYVHTGSDGQIAPDC